MISGAADSGEATSATSSLAAALKSEAKRIGFDLIGIAPAVSPPGLPNFQEWLKRGFAGEMAWLPGRENAYSHPNNVLPRVQSIVMLGLNYRTEDPPPSAPGAARVSRYAWGERDYHDLLRERLKALADFLHRERPGCRTRGVVDTAPLLERDFARLAGLGWFGKNTLLINKQAGSWLFLSALLTDVELDSDEPHSTSHCGTCTRCLDVCPTDAFPEPYVLDARKCIAYLNIELKGPIPHELREGMGDWLFGCDLCQDVCPWNRKAPRTSEQTFQPRAELRPADGANLLRLSPVEFERRFQGTPLERPGRAGLLRNAAIVLGNSDDRSAVPALCNAVNDEEPVVRGAAAWALGKIGGDEAINILKAQREVESDATVIDELNHAIDVIHIASRA